MISTIFCSIFTSKTAVPSGAAVFAEFTKNFIYPLEILYTMWYDKRDKFYLKGEHFMKEISMKIDMGKTLSRIEPEIYGHFAEHLGRCVYDGLYVGEDSTVPNHSGVRCDVIDALKKIHIPVLRWPGGCFADEYHWLDGVGEKSKRKRKLNVNWGYVTEDNSFGTHEYFELCEELGCEPYLAGNVGTGTVQELADWIEYITFDGDSPMSELRRENGRDKPWKLKYLGIGNEAWGCGGNMRPEYYADEYKKYQTFCRNFGGSELYKIACGPSADDYNWTEVLLKNLNQYMTKGISLHYYTVPYYNWAHKGSARDFTDEDYYATIVSTLQMEELLTKHTEIMDKYDSEGNIALVVDEWGCWFDVEEGTEPSFLYQQNTMRDAIVAAINLNLFNHHSRRVKMANLAQAVNVLQSLILTEGEKMVLTPTYHVFDLYKTHQGGELVESTHDDVRAGANGEIPMLTESASVKDGVLTVTLANCSIDESAEISCELDGIKASSAQAKILSADSCRALNDFDSPENVVPADYKVELDERGFKAVLPPCSVVSVIIK